MSKSASIFCLQPGTLQFIVQQNTCQLNISAQITSKLFLMTYPILSQNKNYTGVIFQKVNFDSISLISYFTTAFH